MSNNEKCTFPQIGLFSVFSMPDFVMRNMKKIRGSPLPLMVDSWSDQTSPFSGHLSGPPFLRSSLEKNAPHAYFSSLLNHDQLGLHETTAWALDFPSTRAGKPTPSGLGPILSGYLAFLVPFRASPEDLFSLPLSTTTTKDTSQRALWLRRAPRVFFSEKSSPAACTCYSLKCLWNRLSLSPVLQVGQK